MNEENKISADPTKEFFINMLTRDIATDRAILDLIDNSIDAAQSNKIENPKIEITATSYEFKILDNCGGLDLETAKNYAFRFGRPKEAPETPNSVGQFGVGMKRTLFKLGTEFEVKSKRKNIAYAVSVDVNKWVNTDTWNFYFNTIGDESIKEGETQIHVSKLKDDISELFSEDAFINNLMREISSAYFEQINKGFKIKFNKTSIKSKDITIKKSSSLGVIKKTYTLNNVEITITCGVSDRDKDDSGWYITCNGRLVAEADKTEMTGWGINGNNKFHTDFAFFRGLVEFKCEDSSKLPWTTTKTGVEVDSKVYKSALHHMGLCMEPVLTFLRDRTEENTLYEQEEIASKPLAECIAEADTIRILEAPLSMSFDRPEKIVAPKKKKGYTTISYTVPDAKLEKAKTSLNVRTAKEVGQKTFDYYYGYECEDE
ncbi:ATP-binding protein [Pseudomonas luteola]|uniref:ATP-binding protein n=1 Tax=Pseudomonas luteola TaxID=47886 RepID=UPI001238D445|nr:MULTISPECIES: ATP-binding protein [Pseudomonas]MBA1249937.1 ATP-binding protein [Pseudomonas zeshuii]QEU28768.1 ATP-binding protein [Pseudomonas luteola]